MRRCLGQWLVVCLVTFWGSPPVPGAVSIQEFVKAKKKWPSQVGLRQVIEGRYAITGRILLKFQHCQLEFRSTEPLPKLSRRSKRDVNVQVVGRLRRDGQKLFFQVERISKQDDDLVVYARRRPTGSKVKASDWFVLADWASRRGSFYDDPLLQEKASEANRNGIGVARSQASGKLQSLRDVSRLAVTRGAGADVQRAIEHEAFQLELRAAAGKLEVLGRLRDRIGRGLVGARDSKNGASGPLLVRYRQDPVAVYDQANSKERLTLHRALYTSVAMQLIELQARAAGSSGYQVAETIRREIPEAVGEAARWERLAMDADLKRVVSMSRAELDRLSSRMKAAGRAVEAASAVDDWLEARRGKLMDDGVAGRLRWADLLLALKNDRRRAVTTLIEADGLKPDDREVAERLEQLGYEKKEGKWGPVPSGKGGRPRRDTVPVGVQVGMSGKRLLAAMGAPRRMTRVAVRGAISEIWVYGDPGGSRIAVHLVRTRDADNAVVRSISQLPSRR